ncbi:PREDICTED: angiopoietin-2 [Nicrophorus vespilloides]|uniref:Angiopoietin-2 n=1 Tax=Nicrophorus vespilloides TaxID=110193 RepID=A0ABM1MV85_NICVS|nr:PREDICTED: angiopoietin-2 [Nicrophorus vespilloides]
MRGADWCLLVGFAAALFAAAATDAAAAPGETPKGSPKLPRTSAVIAAAAAQNKTQSGQLRNPRTVSSTIGPPPGRGASSRTREQYLFDVFEAIISTLDSKLQRIENLDKAVEHLMRRVENLDSRVNNNIDKTESVISKLRHLDLKLFQSPFFTGKADPKSENSDFVENNLGMQLVSLDQKVSDIDSKLSVLKTQLDSNYLANEDINAEASEKKPISMNVVEITKALNTEILNHVTKKLDQLKEVTGNLDRNLQYHVNVVSENLGRVLTMVSDVHEAVVDQGDSNRTTTTQPPFLRSSKLDTLVRQMKPIINVSEKMDEVWDVVVGTKSSVDDLVPKSDELLTQTQRQERAIGEMHSDFRSKANKIIANLDMVEKRLKKQEDDVATLAQRPVPAELLLDPTIDRLVEYDSNRYSVDEFPPATDTTIPVTYTTLPPPTTATQVSSTINMTSTTFPSTSSTQQTSSAEKRAEKRKGGVIFPSVKNKPSPANTTFTTDAVASIKDVKGYSCVDLLNAGMRDSNVYYLQIRGTTYWFLKVFCEQEIADGGWTVIQRRDDYGDPRENFNRDWNDYKNGFGDPAKEFWLGNENIYMLTNNEEYILRVELEDFEGNKRYAQYSHFKIYSEAEYYKLEIDGYEGNAGDSLNDPWYGSNNSPFSTYNRDNDRSSLNCASMLKGGWWWKSCGRGLNGLYLNDPQDLTARQGIVWFRWRGWDYTLKKASMMIKPKGFINTT